jgi:hypothetical protein
VFTKNKLVEANKNCELAAECPVSEALCIYKEPNVPETLFLLNSFGNSTTRQDMEQDTDSVGGNSVSCIDMQSALETLNFNAAVTSRDEALHTSGPAAEIMSSRDAHLATRPATAAQLSKKPAVPPKPNVAAMLLGEATAALQTGTGSSCREKRHAADMSAVVSKERQKPVVPPKPKINL